MDRIVITDARGVRSVHTIALIRTPRGPYVCVNETVGTQLKLLHAGSPPSVRDLRHGHAHSRALHTGTNLLDLVS